MAEQTRITRSPTSEELRNYIPIGFVTVEKRFKKELQKIEQEYTKERKPYDSFCALLDFQDSWEQYKKELQRKIGVLGATQEEQVPFNFPNLEKYGDPKRFTLKSKSPIMRDVIVDGVKVPKLIGHYYEYVSKVRGNGISVEIPLQDFTVEPKTLDEDKVRKAK